MSCQDDNNIPLNQVSEEEDSQFSQNFGNSQESRFIGTVVNENNNPISGVSVTIGNAIAITDSNGVFAIEQATVYEKFAYIRASKAGFIDGSRTIVPSNGVNQIKIMLLDMEVVATINSGEQSTVSLPNGTAIDFSGDYVNTLGNAYSGSVQVILKHLSPEDDNLNIMMPGMLFAENANGEPRALETYGMVAVELRGANNEELQLANGSPAQITVPLPATLTNAPAIIPLWYFDEANGYWKEEGQATLQGNTYVGDVTHFSFWNYDAQFPAIYLCINLVDEQGEPISTYVTLTHSNNSYLYPTTSGYTSPNGVVCGLVPQDEELIFNIPSYGCANSSFSTTIGPFSEDATITVTVTGSNAATTLTGTFNDCLGNPITNGYMQLYYNNEPHTIPVTNGMITQVIEFCDTNTAFSAQVIDLNASQSTHVVTGNFTAPTTDLGTSMSCVDLSDSDNDGVIDIDEDINGNNNLDDDDTDGDQIPNYLDEDDDGDGVNTIDEDRDNDGDPTNDDSDGDQIPDYLDSQDVVVNFSEVFAQGCDPYNSPTDLTVDYPVGSYNNTYMYYETQADAEAEVNPIANPEAYININMLQIVFVKATNTISNQSAIGEIYLNAMQYQDSDQDGLTDCEELTGVDDPNFNCNPNGYITDPDNPDTDGDGFNDCDETQAGTDPTDINDFPTSTGLTLEKTGVVQDSNQNNVIDFGDEIIYTFTITNDNNFYIQNLLLQDPLLGYSDYQITTILEAGDTFTFTAVYQITTQDIATGQVTNTATIDAQDEQNNPLSDVSDDPTDPTDVDTEGDGEPDDVTVIDLQ